jgi:hypothetical protein
MSESVFLIASGDLRLSANQKCWPAQESVEASVIAAIRGAGREVKRGHPFDSAKGHGFIDSQKYGMQVFRVSSISASYSLTVGGQPAEVQYVGLAPGFVGLYQANFKLPTLTAGSHPMVLTIDGVSSNAASVVVEGSAFEAVVDGGESIEAARRMEQNPEQRLPRRLAIPNRTSRRNCR